MSDFQEKLNSLICDPEIISAFEIRTVALFIFKYISKFDRIDNQKYKYIKCEDKIIKFNAFFDNEFDGKMANAIFICCKYFNKLSELLQKFDPRTVSGIYTHFNNLDFSYLEIIDKNFSDIPHVIFMNFLKNIDTEVEYFDEVEGTNILTCGELFNLCC